MKKETTIDIEEREKWFKEFEENIKDAPDYKYYYTGGLLGILLVAGFLALNLYIMIGV